MPRRIRVLIVDDSIVACKIIADALASDPDFVIAATVHSGAAALSRFSQYAPDVMILDVDMPDMDGLRVLAEIRKTHPRLPVIMCSGLTGVGSTVTVRALLSGATDYVTKPRSARPGDAGNTFELFRKELQEKIRASCRSDGASAAEATAPFGACAPMASAQVEPWTTAHARPRIEVVAIAVSTGGPKALAEIIPRLPADFPVPILIVQHMPPPFTRSLAEGLSRHSSLVVEEGYAGGLVVAGKVWIAPAGFHMTLARRGSRVELAINEDPPVLSCRPSANILFHSVAMVYGASALGVVLTGMGTDGCEGAAEIRKAGGGIFVQDEASSVVWGMPGAVAKAGLHDRMVSLGRMAGILQGAVMLGRGGGKEPGYGH